MASKKRTLQFSELELMDTHEDEPPAAVTRFVAVLSDSAVGVTETKDSDSDHDSLSEDQI